jgi:hypothetical protein
MKCETKYDSEPAKDLVIQNEVKNLVSELRFTPQPEYSPRVVIFIDLDKRPKTEQELEIERFSEKYK